MLIYYRSDCDVIPLHETKKNLDVSVNALGKFAGSRFLSEVPRVAVIMGVSNHNYTLIRATFYQFS